MKTTIRKILASFIVLSTISPLQLFANSDSSPLETKITYFQKIQELYNNGHKMDLKTLEDKLMPGRCFRVSSPHYPSAAYFNVTKKMGDVGPIDTSDISYVAMMQEVTSVPANYFDSITVKVSDSKISKYRYPLSLDESESYVLSFPATGEVAAFRESGPYIVSLVMTTYGAPELACYFFERHAPKTLP